MAEKSSDALKKLEEQLTCPICLDQYISPKILPCLHPFCHQCLEGLPLHPQGKKLFLSCPTCRTPVELPTTGVTGFPAAFLINNLTEVHSLLKKGSDDQHVSCDNCKKSDATGYCKQCSKFYCAKCLGVHNDWVTFVDHTVTGLDEVTHTAIQQPEQPNITPVKSNKITDVHNGIEEVTNSKAVSCEPENRGISSGKLCRAVAKYSFEAQDNSQLSLEAGQIVEILGEYGNGWSIGRVNGVEGFVPSSYVKKLDIEVKSKIMDVHQGIEEVTNSKAVSCEPENRGISTGKLCRAVANYSYEAQDDDELSLEAGQIVEILVEHENGWWLGRVNGVEGFVPSNYVKKLDIEDKPLLKARVKYDYVTCQEDELTLRVGDIVDVLEQETSKEGWWKVRLRDKDGLAPDNFLEINDNKGEEVMKVPTQQTHRKRKTSEYEVVTIRTTNHDEGVVNHNQSEEKATICSTEKKHELQKSEWFFGKMTHSIAEKKLLQIGNKPGTFLIRKGKSHPENYVLSIRGEDKVHHLLIYKVDSSGYYLDSHAQFSSIEDLLKYYQKNPNYPCCLTVSCPK